MGGSRQPRGLRRAEQILEAAEELVASVGVAAAGMNALARHAGVSPGTLYQYFPHRRAVVDALLRRLAAELPGRAEARVGEVCEALAALAERRPALLPLLCGAEPQDEPNVLLQALSACLARALGSEAHDSPEGAVGGLAARILVQGVAVALRCGTPDARAVLLDRTRVAMLAAGGPPGAAPSSSHLKLMR
ncbi:TetR/AcrR family transcriptional regulator [Streptomyces sp. NPDC101234]|uniref:TetR/AcrR family transcriptional regulator n=1 Tax=Streptomyces sp. NPDC101234 TaxID=3366138 RepID=UPI003811B8B8